MDGPIVVGYAFGPKKMSTMGVVMAEASGEPSLESVSFDAEYIFDTIPEDIPSRSKNGSSVATFTTCSTTVSPGAVSFVPLNLGTCVFIVKA